MPTTLAAETADAYDALAPAYDILTAEYDYDRWLDEIEAWALAHGLRGRRLLDVACGTGSSFLPLLGRGYRVTACDVSGQMLVHAARKCGDAADLYLADMTELPRFGSFDLATCLDDALNHLLDEEALGAAFAGMAANLDEGGLLVFDLNTLHAYNTVFASEWATEGDDRFIVWRGQGGGDETAGCLAGAQVDVFTRDDDGRWARSATTHRQRHFSPATVAARLAAAGLELVASRGQLPGAVLEPTIDEARHTKALYLARKGARMITRP